MKLDPKQTAFGRHETFPLRYAWLTKGFEAITAEPAIFSEPDRAMVELGVGRNMVNAIQYWLAAARLVEFAEGQGRATAFGNLMLGDDGDPYLEDEATLWIIHWLIASNPSLATGFFWFFNHYAMPRFQDDEVRAGLTGFTMRELHLERSQSTLKSDVSTLLRMYTLVADKDEDHLDSPLAQLGLIEPETDTRTRGKGRHYRSPRAARPFLPPVALHFALADRFADDPAVSALPVRLVLYGGDDRAAPGAVFRLNEDGLMAALAQVMNQWPGHYQLRDTAGVHQVYRGERPAEPLDVLRHYYHQAAA